MSHKKKQTITYYLAQNKAIHKCLNFLYIFKRLTGVYLQDFEEIQFDLPGNKIFSLYC